MEGAGVFRGLRTPIMALFVAGRQSHDNSAN
jgi:hypothetical protein